MPIEFHSVIDDSPPIPSSTVMVVRDAAVGVGLEVLMIRRHTNSKVLGGVYVFPGGKVDAADMASNQSQRAGPTGEACRRRLSEPDLAADFAWGLYAAALRETFEETGLVLGAPGDVGADAGRLVREQMANGGVDFAQAIQILGWSHAFDALVPWSRWVTPRTPVMMNKRFDTRFYVAVAPSVQTVLHCEREVAGAVWFSPRRALELVWSGEIDMAPPQIMSVAHLAHMGSVRRVLRWAQENPPPLIIPEVVGTDSERVICYPGDPLHSVKAVPWPCPTRMFFSKGRFEAEGGLAAMQGLVSKPSRRP